ncbi:MAG TPA: phosphohistidine phosphatase SixA [Gemmataceae bacterium]|nr:phosphohistidine phosphatase SixA [Gemmataceae bacterium]
MELYIIRHADAQPLGEGDVERDEDRPLTAKGHTQCGPLAAALQRQGVHLDRIVTSSLLRARQTAENLIQDLAAPKPELHICDHLAPGGKRRKLTRFLIGLGAQSMAVVGHMPDLALYAGWLIGSRKAQIDLAKAGVACIHFEDEADKGTGALVWMVTPEWCT